MELHFGCRLSAHHLNYTPTTFGVQSLTEITSRGTGTGYVCRAELIGIQVLYFLFALARPAVGHTQPSVHRLPGRVFPKDGREADRLPIYSAEG
jgi:hypothetical protein